LELWLQFQQGSKNSEQETSGFACTRCKNELSPGVAGANTIPDAQRHLPKYQERPDAKRKQFLTNISGERQLRDDAAAAASVRRCQTKEQLREQDCSLIALQENAKEKV